MGNNESNNKKPNQSTNNQSSNKKGQSSNTKESSNRAENKDCR
ncbi:MAG: hypothetical protein RR461_11640 [Angelakisella sp.]